MMSSYSIIIKQKGSTSSECESAAFSSNFTDFGEASDLANVTVGKYVQSVSACCLHLTIFRYEYVIDSYSLNMSQVSCN